MRLLFLELISNLFESVFYAKYGSTNLKLLFKVIKISLEAFRVAKLDFRTQFNQRAASDTHAGSPWSTILCKVLFNNG